MELAIFAGSGNPPLAAAIASALEVPLGQRRLARSPDGELRVEMQDNLLCGALTPPADSIVVAPDMGALRLAERYGRALGLPIAIVAKVRVSDEEVVAQNVIGEVQGRTPLIVDDMIITGATVEAALHAVLAVGAVRNATVVATHGLFVGQAASRLRALPITRLLVTDSTAIAPALALPIEVVTLAPLLAQVISRLHAGEPLGDLTGQG
jgi:ribose-phosphate pyrophosphokinase